ncbi:PREDICTED: uncharacterized protein LOC104597346 [Nelumbo nucifera]|uniref:Uncharacterized protein LOC104597346 n=1 Tax=Nelumbo nucifera TaxID=4432 RepID=A0A1U8A5M7_NELNU|nr:PREDICTED: uncharacterized protein LOC104597346 [Nelumbo nucifera]
MLEIQGRQELAVFRNEEGKFITPFSGPIGEGDSLRVELMAVLEGVKRAKEMGIHELIIEGDSKLVVGWLNDERSGFWNDSNERKMFKWLTQDIEVKVVWVKRNTNSIADGLAKQGVNRDAMLWA